MIQDSLTDLGFRIQGPRLSVQDTGYRVLGVGFIVKGFRVGNLRLIGLNPNRDDLPIHKS